MEKILKSKVFLAVLSLILIFGILAPIFPDQVFAQTQPIRIISEKIENKFPKGIQFSLEIESKNPLKEIVILYQFSDRAVTNRGLFTISATKNGKTQAEYFLRAYDVYGVGGYIPPFADIYFWYSIRDEKGNRLLTKESLYLYEDPRFKWQIIKGENYDVYWYPSIYKALHEKVAQQAFEAADYILKRGKEDLGAILERPIKVVVYSLWEDMRIALGIEKRDGLIVAGKAFSPHDLVFILGHPEPGILAQLKKVVYHEIGHLLVHQLAEGRYGGPPVWLDEGIAMYFQEIDNAPPYPYPGHDPHYFFTLQTIEGIKSYNLAVDRYLKAFSEFKALLEKYSLPGGQTQLLYEEIVQSHKRLKILHEEFLVIASSFSLTTLGAPASRQVGPVMLHYANYWSIVYYLVNEYDGQRLKDLLAGIKKKGNYRKVFSEVYGMTVDDFERKWHQHLKLKPFPPEAKKLPELPPPPQPLPPEPKPEPKDHWRIAIIAFLSITLPALIFFFFVSRRKKS